MTNPNTNITGLSFTDQLASKGDERERNLIREASQTIVAAKFSNPAARAHAMTKLRRMQRRAVSLRRFG
ncbi:MAG: hypothetical protein GYB49_09365 [Alphaproteobacteria bacterium]|nr:hypothetical protein [Hyphomonas sp.]MBR9807417.1 hypothetical protein [Alphaproteobacteria bacterium]